MNNTELLDGASSYVGQYIKTHNNKTLLYHNLDHTKLVVAAAQQIANHYHLEEKDFFAVIIAAWFHDLGYYNGPVTGHEERGAAIAEEYLTGRSVESDIVNTVSDCILSTKMPQDPKNLLQQIVCDADLFHLGGDQFSERNKLLHKEMELMLNKGISKADWRKGTIKLLESHHYHTDYCQLLLNEKKQQNLEKIKMKLASMAESIRQPPPAVRSEPEVKKEKPMQPGRGIETMFRITSGNNQRLSDMADNKAHILITVNSIILSAIISLLLRKLDESSFLTYPTFTLLAVSVVTIVVSILATRPSIPSGVFSKQDIDDKKVNLLFFGNFYRMDLQDYTDGMRMLMSDSDFLYGTLIKDIYSQGVVLGRKYRLLRVAYNIFMFGLIISMLGFIAVFVIYT
jgi:predicted metal-dependent HD superfamily phosphohydrolase